MEVVLRQMYRKPKQPASFGSISALHRALKGRVKVRNIQKWLQMKDSYTLHKPLRHKFLQNHVIVGSLNEQFQSDLVDMQSLQYIMMDINTYSRVLIFCLNMYGPFL